MVTVVARLDINTGYELISVYTVWGLAQAGRQVDLFPSALTRPGRLLVNTTWQTSSLLWAWADRLNEARSTRPGTVMLDLEGPTDVWHDAPDLLLPLEPGSFRLHEDHACGSCGLIGAPEAEDMAAQLLDRIRRWA
jgi:hypothetical protein